MSIRQFFLRAPAMLLAAALLPALAQPAAPGSPGAGPGARLAPSVGSAPAIVPARPADAGAVSSPTNPANPASPAGAGGAASALTLRQALTSARDNLDVAIARGNLAAARADILGANHAPLPTLSGSAESIDLKNGIGGGNVLTQKRIDKKIGLDWTLERGGKRALRTAAARQSADAAVAEVQDVQVQQLLAALNAYYDLLAAQDRVVQVTEIEGSATQLESSANRRVQAGDLPAQDAARIEIETRRARADVQQARLERQRAAIALAQAIDTRLVPATLRADDGWPVLPRSAMEPADYALLAEQRPDVRAALARVQAAQTNLDGAVALRKGDVTVGATYEHYPGVSTRLLSVRASIPLQWGYAYEGEIGRAQALYTQAQDALERARRDGSLELRGLQEAALTAEQRVRSYDDEILPRARRVAEGAELAYKRGAIPLADVLDARRILRATQLEAVAARADYAKTLGAWTLRTRPALLVEMP